MDPVTRFRFLELCEAWHDSGRPTRGELLELLKASVPVWVEQGTRSSAAAGSLRCWWPSLQRWGRRLRVLVPDLPEDEPIGVAPSPQEGRDEGRGLGDY